ncbi:MAG TPA: hypothetical protein DCS07_09070 [Bdellovibrionales bacterium]|nr:MAG: hypothetical protein A2Z97_12680 [Bdellovibrionales bacterium GWB1_52_6]OFZ02861.1 MAG: hypothetical protein A2X97_04620 [Bdellovibrionales bacterium GWA1_52_35]OFZ40239.1 MAG: hypothetical protein A2070_10440 [Bdellovibrionales bacterium GWC1_52_8]HAR42761.1 hypothetical protein [Bdellovibrionales bacterium]HCM38442.1 hypothetical protein [Bdellovibrionales bacterium]
MEFKRKIFLNLLFLISSVSVSAWAEISIEIKGDEVIAIETDGSGAAPVKYTLGKTVKAQKGSRFYHWSKEEDSKRWLGQGKVDSGELDFLITQFEGQAAGGGYYGSLDSLDSSGFGTHVVAVDLPSELKGIKGTYPRKTIKDKIELARKLRESGYSFFQYDSNTWFNFIDPSALESIKPVLTDDFVKSNAFTQLSKLAMLETHGLIDLNHPEVQKQHPETVKIFRGLPLSPEERAKIWNQFLNYLYSRQDLGPKLARYFRPEITIELSQKIRESAPDFKMNSSTFEYLVRTGRQLGLDFESILGTKAPHRPKVSLLEFHPTEKAIPDILKLDPFGQKLARAMEFIDYNDLMLELAQGAGEPWRRYDTDGQRPLLERWVEATAKTPDGIAKGSTEQKLRINRILSGNPSADIRNTPIVAGGDIMVGAKGYYRITEFEKRALEANPYLSVEIIPDPTARKKQRLYLGRHEYPSAKTYRKFENLLSPELVTELRAAEAAGTLENSELTRKVLGFLIESVEKSDSGATGYGKYQKFLSIHPFSDYNGRTFRALYQAQNEKPLFLRDFDHDLFLKPEQFIPEALNGEGQLLAIRQKMLEEHARNPGSPRYYDIPELWRVAVESDLTPKDPSAFVRDVKAFYLSPENQDLIRKKKLFDFDKTIKNICVSRRIQMFLAQ